MANGNTNTSASRPPVNWKDGGHVTVTHVAPPALNRPAAGANVPSGDPLGYHGGPVAGRPEPAGSAAQLGSMPISATGDEQEEME
jgi:hypothetical protein